MNNQLSPLDRTWCKATAADYIADLHMTFDINGRDLDERENKMIIEVIMEMHRLMGPRKAPIATNFKTNPILREIPECYINKEDE